MSTQVNQKRTNVETITELKAFEATYKAACKFHGAAPYKPFLKLLQQCQARSTPCDQPVYCHFTPSLRGRLRHTKEPRLLFLASIAVDASNTTSVIECLSCYASVKSLRFYGCDVGDEGLSAIAVLLRASASNWWRGSKLNTLELCADGRLLPVTTPQKSADSNEPVSKPNGLRKVKATAAKPGTLPAATAAAAGGPLEATAAAKPPPAAAAGNADLLSSRLTQKTVPLSSSMHKETVNPGSPTGNVNRDDSINTLMTSSTQGVLHPMSPLASQRNVNSIAMAQGHSLPGICPPVPQHLQLIFLNQMQLAQQALNDRFGSHEHVRYKSQPPRALLEMKKGSLQALQHWKRQQQQLPLPLVQQAHAALQLQAVTGQLMTQHQQTVQLQQNHQQAGKQVTTYAAPPLPARLQAEPCPRFSACALKDLSLSLGVAGLSLLRLALDHTLLGDAGTARLAAGISKCTSLKQLSLCYCGVRTAGVKELAAALAPTAYADAPLSYRSTGTCAAAGISRLATGSSSMPIPDGANTLEPTVAARMPRAGIQLQQLWLSGNTLRGCGLQALNPALRAMSALEVLGLADIGVTEADKVQLQGFVHALAVGPSQLKEADFDANYIGDQMASLFLTLLSTKPSLTFLKLTGRLSSETMTKLTTLQQQNLKEAKPGKSRNKE